tara:strand:- start:228 stop:503 length:276 start_codon:yes stop_codon:yes gene_type:complete
MLKIGYTKDIFATFAFLGALILTILCKDLNIYKNFIIHMLATCFLVDAFFSLSTKYHCVDVGPNGPTYSLLIGFLVVIFGIYYYLIKGKKT